MAINAATSYTLAFKLCKGLAPLTQPILANHYKKFGPIVAINQSISKNRYCSNTFAAYSTMKRLEGKVAIVTASTDG